MNSSFGVEDGLQQPQMVVDDSKKESASICEVSRVYSELRSMAH